MNEVVCKHRTDIEGQIFCQKKKEFIRAIIRDLKNLGISLLIAAIIVGLIVFFAIAQDM